MGLKDDFPSVILTKKRFEWTDWDSAPKFKPEVNDKLVQSNFSPAKL